MYSTHSLLGDSRFPKSGKVKDQQTNSDNYSNCSQEMTENNQASLQVLVLWKSTITWSRTSFPCTSIREKDDSS